jgi:MoaA/NifB/PqqE/SkfB family radical SAM enzyme
MNKQDKTTIIWNVTRLGPWNCKICCVDAICSHKNGQVNIAQDMHYSYEDELTFIQKKEIINQLMPNKFEIDFSGGELLVDPLNIDLVLHASERLGAQNIGISISGAFLTDEIIDRLSGKISNVELTLDYVPFKPYHLRPFGYHEQAAYAIMRLKEKGISVGVQTVLLKDNMQEEKLTELLKWLEKNNVDEWSLLRFFPSGRGKNYSHLMPTNSDYNSVVSTIKHMARNSHIKLSFQYLLPNHSKHTLECRAVKKSIGILPNGKVIACFWAISPGMRIEDDLFYLGDLKEQSINEILSGNRAKYWRDKKHLCKYFLEHFQN